VSSAAALRRHHHEVGAPLAVHRHRIGTAPIVIAIVIWVLITIPLLLSPATGAAVAAGIAFVLALLLGAAVYLSGGEILAICERGVVLGSVAPLRSLFVVRYDQMTPGSVVPVVRSRLFARTLNIYSVIVSVRNVSTVTQGVYFVGPSPLQCRRPALPLPSLARPAPLTVDGRYIWFGGTTDVPQRTTELIAQAAQRQGLQQLAAATATAPPRELTGQRKDAARLLPGFPPA